MPTNNTLSRFADKFKEADPLVRAQFAEIVANLATSRSQLFERMLDPRRDIDAECGHPKTENILPDNLRDLYDRLSIAARVVEVLPRESWKTPPTVYEVEDPNRETVFERAWKDLGNSLKNESFHQDEEGNPVWEILSRADEISGIGHFGVILLGISDGKSLSEPVEGIDECGRMVNRKKNVELMFIDDDDNILTEEEMDSKEEAEAAEKAMENGELPPGQEDQKAKDGEFGAEDDDAEQQDPEQVKEEDEDFIQNLFGSFDTEGNSRLGADAQYGQPALPFHTPGKTGKPCLIYARAYDESLVKITRWEDNPGNPRYGMPVMYQLTLNDHRDNHSGGIGLSYDTVDVHWTRIIHIADNLTTSEWAGTPRMRPVLNHLLDLKKLYGGSAEMYWRGAFPGLSLETHPEMGGDVEIDDDALKDKLEKWANGLQRYFWSAGMTANTLAPTVVDPTPQINVHIEAICVKLGIPKRIFMGSERGELASSQDDGTWNDRVQGRQNNYITPRIIIPFVDRLIAIGVLPQPTGFSVYWEKMDSISAKEKAEIANTLTTAMSTYVSGDVEALMSPEDYYTSVLGKTDKEAQAFLENVKTAEPLNVGSEVPMFDQDGNPIDSNGNMIDPETGLPMKTGPDGQPLEGGDSFGGEGKDPAAEDDEDDAPSFPPITNSSNVIVLNSKQFNKLAKKMLKGSPVNCKDVDYLYVKKSDTTFLRGDN